MRLVPLREVATIQLGKMLSPKAKIGEDPYPYLRNQNVQWGRFDLRDIAKMDFTPQDRQKFDLQVGDLLVCEGGEPGRCAVWRGDLQSCYFQKAIHRVRPYPCAADSDFLALWIRFQALTGTFEDQNAKTTIAHLPLVRLERLPVPALDIQQQRSVAAKLATQLNEVDTARHAAETQARERLLLRQRMLRDAFAALQDAPLKKLGEHAPTTSGTTPSRGNRRYWDPGEIPWVKTGEIAFGLIHKTEESISSLALAECSLTLLPRRTVLIAMYGQGKTRGQSAILEIPAATNQACFAVLPNATWDSDFLFYWFSAKYQELRNISEDRGGNQANLNGALLKTLEVPAPDRQEQIKLARRIKAALVELDLLEATSKALLSDLRRLPQSLLFKAFGK